MIDLKRWGLVTTAIFAAGFAGGRWSAFTGPISRLAEMKVDSIRIADAAAARADARSRDSFRLVRTDLLNQLALARQAQVVRVVRTREASEGLDSALARLRAATTALPALQALVATVQAHADTLAAEEQRERLGAAAAMHAADSVILADRAELRRDSTTVARLNGEVAAGIERERKLAKQIGGGWTLGVTIGPGASYKPTPPGTYAVAVSPVQATVGLSHSIHIRIPNPFHL